MSLIESLENALRFRNDFLNEPHDTAFRLFNGFTENVPGLCIDIFAKTAVIYDSFEENEIPRQEILSFLNSHLPWLKCIVMKRRRSSDPEERRGCIIYGTKPDTRITENGVRYFVDPLMNHDCGFYADTKNLRKWLIDNSAGKRVLNTFAYTGSLGVAAAAGGAVDFVQTDLSEKFLSCSGRSFSMNGIRYTGKNLIAGDFFHVMARFKKENRKFDIVILDPPFFSSGSGEIQLQKEPVRLINKIRPIVADNGIIAVVNNSLYLSGNAFISALDELCDGVYLSRDEIIPVPSDFTGSDPEYSDRFPEDPAPFNHPTKIILLKVRVKE